ncbi:MAG: bifunctional diaminohydroxyphosphoribosylaminopyrimidine deaminase/5-amino-6-(5-phosphoribosylamino)uracil reductase RibD [Sulfobacillus acidophilus]|uniref:Riboflavin biosynthesis protein RibD n=1 Tax=Sulfobacillus acidophilus TaxID=53633 RepID=A0A2T2WGE3_9FIRM|nr:MAG: bifunctional diaminohydroxyphosphoribosylaminopyrimidine deaminase/5-amino-6-(5-phosphoribosylamino)uracil reductase RibD [Sulfobacillus acidophilus]
MTSRYMKRALVLARRGLGTTSPNPMVGAVIVDPHGHVVAEGYHKKAGGPHAEVVALGRAGQAARGCTLYVTLEPCNHTGRTPPCTDAIIQSGIRRVIIATADPNPHVPKGGIERLRQSGIEVVVGDGADEARMLNRPFFTWSVVGRPWVTLKIALSLDGKVATTTGESKYLTSAQALQHAHELRRQHDAILVGSGTILTDDPHLTYRGRRQGSDPVRVILDSRGRVSAEAAVFQSESPAPTLVFTREDTSIEWERELFAVGAEVIRLSPGSDGHLSIPHVLSHLAERRILSVLVEGGPSIHAAFIAHHLADRWVGYLAPVIVGGVGAPSAVAGTGFSLDGAPRLHIETVARHGPDVVIDAQFLWTHAAAAVPSHVSRMEVH